MGLITYDVHVTYKGEIVHESKKYQAYEIAEGYNLIGLSDKKPESIEDVVNTKWFSMSNGVILDEYRVMCINDVDIFIFVGMELKYKLSTFGESGESDSPSIINMAEYLTSIRQTHIYDDYAIKISTDISCEGLYDHFLCSVLSENPIKSASYINAEMYHYIKMLYNKRRVKCYVKSL